MFSVLTFNIQNGQVWDDADPDNAPVDLNQTLAFIREQDADIVFLQEVERGVEGGAQVEPPPNYEFLRAKLEGYDSIFGYPLKNPLEIPFGLGLAIFSKTPLRNPGRENLPPAPVSFNFGGKTRRPSHRLLLGAETVVEGRPLGLLNTHLQAFFMIDATSNEFPAQRNIVASHLRDDGHAMILAGDFNCAPNDTLVDQFCRCGFKASQSTEITWRRMPFVLDHIFYNTSLRLESCKVIPTPASDHHAVRSVFSFV